MGSAKGTDRQPFKYYVHEAIEVGGTGHFAGLGTLFAAGIFARTQGPVLWCLHGRDLFMPALSRVGLHPDRVIFCETWNDRDVLPAMEEGLKCKSLAGVVGEVTRLSLTASRRLQLAAAESGVTAFIIRRWRNTTEKNATNEPNAAATRWRIAPHPSTTGGFDGMPRQLWQAELLRARGASRIRGFWRRAMRRVISLCLPHWPSDRLRRASKDVPARDKPLVTAMMQGQRRVMASVDVASARLGLRCGMTVTHAQSLVPDLSVMNAAPQEDEAALLRLAIWCIKYSPLVTPDPPEGIFIDVAGSAHLFRGEAALINDLCQRLKSDGITAKAALADTAGCAWALARYGETEIVSPGRASEATASLPVAALRLAPEIVASLSDVGIERVAQLASKPRSGLRRRFGAEVLLRLDQALGNANEALTALILPEVPRAELRFAEPVGDPDDLKRIIEKLADRLCLQLEERGIGARRLDLVFVRVDNIAQAARIGLSRPHREPKHLVKLLAESLVVIDPGFGIESASLTASWVEALAERQTVSRQLGASGLFLSAARERPVYSELFCSDTALSATRLAAARATQSAGVPKRFTNCSEENTMNRRIATGLTLLTGVAIGATAIQGLHAQAKPPTYVVVALRKINDAATFKTAVADKAAAALTPFGGRFVIRTDKITTLDGPPPQRFVLLQFDSPEKAQAWHVSEAQKEIDAARMKTTDSLSFVVEGMAN